MNRRRLPSCAALLVIVSLGLAACGPGETASERAADPTAAPVASLAAATSAPAATPSPVFGAFRRTAVTVPPEILAPAEELCRTRPVPPTAEEIGSRPLVVSDTRGLGVVILVFADDAGATGCRVEIDQAGGMAATHFAVDASPEGPLDRGAVTLGALEFVDEGTVQRVVAVGRVGDGTVRVNAGFADDTYVYSTKANGWYAMWWPGAIKPTAVVAVDNKNVVTTGLAPP